MLCPTPSDVLDTIMHDWIDSIIQHMIHQIEKEKREFMTNPYAHFIFPPPAKECGN
jgi:hypothetical protein